MTLQPPMLSKGRPPHIPLFNITSSNLKKKIGLCFKIFDFSRRIGNKLMDGSRRHVFERLRALYNVDIAWSAAPTSAASVARTRRQIALDRIAEAESTPVHSPKSTQKRSRGRPKKLSPTDEWRIAIFIMYRVHMGRPAQNAIVDVEALYEINRSTVFRILSKHRAAARQLARLHIQHGNKQFRPVVGSRKSIALPEFRDWGSNRF